MKAKFIALGAALLSILPVDLFAQKDFAVADITVINIGDGRYLYRERSTEKPVSGEFRIIDGYNSEYILAQFADGMYNGDYQHFKYNKLVEKGAYKDGYRTGDFVEYYSDGTSIKCEKHFTEGKLDGLYKTYYTNGKLESEKGYKNGLENGVERKYDAETDKMTVDCSYVDGKPDGKQTRSITSNAGDFVQVGSYKMGVQIGDYTETWTNGVIRVKGKYKDGKKDGTWLENRKDGKPNKEITYKDGERTGESKTFYTDGTVEKIDTYVNGNKEGVCKEFYYDSGKLKTEYTYANDIREGKYKLYYDDGTLREEGRCEGGKEVYRKEYYRNGKLKQVSERTSRGWDITESYDSNGNQL